MHRPLYRFPLRPSAGALVALVLVACAPAAARASCGDHVIISRGAPAAAEPNPPVPAAPRPCHGPTCSQRPADPAPVAPPTTAEPSEEWGLVAVAPQGADESVRRRLW